MASKIATMPIATMSLEKLLEMRTALDAEIVARSGGTGGATGSGSGAAKKAKKPKRVSQGSAWADFTQMIVKEKADEYTAFKEASETKLGVAPRFVAAYRKAHEAEWEAFQTTWNAEHPKAAKGSVASAAEEPASADEGSVASGGSEKAASGKRRGPKKLADMTPEERAAHDAAVQKRREAKKAPSAAAEEEAKAAAPVVVAAAVAAPAPLPLKAAPAKPVAAPVAEEAEEEEGVEERIFTLDGQKYIRLWDSGAEDWATGDLWAVKANGSGSPQRDYYCGELMEDGSINTDAEEPELD
jgi:hypothetical protein